MGAQSRALRSSRSVAQAADVERRVRGLAIPRWISSGIISVPDAHRLHHSLHQALDLRRGAPLTSSSMAEDCLRAPGPRTRISAHRGLGVAEEHRGLGVVEERVVDAGEAAAHRALEDDDAAGLVDVEDRHAVDRRVRDGAGGGVGDVVGADHERDVGARELAVDVVHLLELLVRDVGLGEQHVHVAGHAAGDGMDGVEDLDAALLELGGEVGDRALGLRHRHAVAGDDDHQARVGELDGDVGGARGARRPATAGRDERTTAAGPHAREEDVGDRAVHRLGHLLGEDRARRADEHAGDDQRRVVERDARGGGATAR